MENAERFRLLGRYRTPRFRYGRKVLCEVRGELVITGLSDGPTTRGAGAWGYRTVGAGADLCVCSTVA